MRYVFNVIASVGRLNDVYRSIKMRKSYRSTVFLKGQVGMPSGKVLITCWDYRKVWLSYWSSYCGATAIFIALLVR